MAGKKRSAEIIKLGKREMISTQQFSTPLVADRMVQDAVNTWFEVTAIAKFVYGMAYFDNVRRVRQNIWALRRELLRRGFLLIAEGRPVTHVKIYVPSPLEDVIAMALLTKMRSKTDISADLYDKAVSIVQHEAVKDSEEDAA